MFYLSATKKRVNHRGRKSLLKIAKTAHLCDVLHFASISCLSTGNRSRVRKYLREKEKALNSQDFSSKLLIFQHFSRLYSLYLTPKPCFLGFGVAGIYGGSDEDRTRYLLHAMEALSQVSYGPTVR